MMVTASGCNYLTFCLTLGLCLAAPISHCAYVSVCLLALYVALHLSLTASVSHYPHRYEGGPDDDPLIA